MGIETYFVKYGKATIYKTPSASLVYGWDMADWLAEFGSSLLSVTATVQGVTMVGDAFIQGTAVCARISGLDLAAGAVNSCTFRFFCTGGDDYDERTIYFEARP